MIQQSAVRIGNYLDFPFCGKQPVTAADMGDWNALGAVLPIALTPETLEKCGFVNDNNTYGRGIIMLRRKRDGAFGQPRFELLSDEFNPDLEHLHQLQNLYFALTGEELNVQL
jgi:hypothetical protein